MRSEVWWLSQGAALFQLFELWGKLAVFFMEHHFYLRKKMADRQTIIIQTLIFGRNFPQNENNFIINNDKSYAFKQKWKCGKLPNTERLF